MDTQSAADGEDVEEDMSGKELMSSKEAHAAAAELHVVLEETPQLLGLVSDMLRPESLPPGWAAHFEESKGRREYTNMETGEVRYEHPLVSYYRGAAFMECGGYQRLVELERQQAPSEEEISAMCAYLHISPDEGAYVREVASLAISAPLPEGWEEEEDENGNVVFRNHDTGEFQSSHPLDAYFMELIHRRRAELQQRDIDVTIKAHIAQQRLNSLGQRAAAAAAESAAAAAQAAASGTDGEDGAVGSAAEATPAAAAASDAASAGDADAAATASATASMHLPALARPSLPSRGSLFGAITGPTGPGTPMSAAGQRPRSTARSLSIASSSSASVRARASAAGASAGPLGHRLSHLPAIDEGAHATDGADGAAAVVGASAAATPQQPTERSRLVSRLASPAAATASPAVAASIAGAEKTGLSASGSASIAMNEGEQLSRSYSQESFDEESLPGSTNSAGIEEGSTAAAPAPALTPRAAGTQPASSAAAATEPGGTPPGSRGQQRQQQPEPPPAATPQQPVTPRAAAADGVGTGAQRAIGSGSPSRIPRAAGLPMTSLDGAITGPVATPPVHQHHHHRHRSPDKSRQASPGGSGAGAGVSPDSKVAVGVNADASGAESVGRGGPGQEGEEEYDDEGDPEGLAAAAAAAAAVRPFRERIRVAVRARPLSHPKQDSLAWVVDTSTNTLRLREQATAVYKHGGASRVFQFDLVLPPDSTTHSLFTSHVAPLVDASLTGVNTAVLAYGQTGSGKTHTMLGPRGSGQDGTIGMALAHLYKGLQDRQQQQQGSDPSSALTPGSISQLMDTDELYRVKLSMLELYNEGLRDLLAPSPASVTAATGSPPFGGATVTASGGSGGNVQLLDDPRLGVRVAGVEEVEVDSLEQALRLVEQGAGARAVGATAMNEQSSRSHTIVRAHVEALSSGGITGGPLEVRRTAQLYFVDLAGSERMSKTGSTGTRFTEGANINLSLLMLGTVVARLAEGRPGDYIPYRNSKLTRLLQPCLGGNARTCIIATVHPGVQQVDETFNTLLFAHRAMAVVNQVYVNRTRKPGEQLQLVAQLRREVELLQAQLRQGGGGGERVAAELTELQSRVSLLESHKAVLLDRLEEITGTPQGGVWEELPPPPPPGLNLPDARPVKRGAGAAVTPDRALRSIARIANLGHAGEDGAAARSTSPSKGRRGVTVSAAAVTKTGAVPSEEPQAVVMSVRRMRAERDELRRRDGKLRSQLAAAQESLTLLQPFAEQQAAIEDAVHTLEDLMGARNSSVMEAAGMGTIDRLRDSVQAAVLLSSELSSLQRQFHTAHALQRAAEQRAVALEEALQRHNERSSKELAATPGAPERTAASTGALSDLEAQLSALKAQHAVVVRELEAWRGFGEQAAAGSGGQQAAAAGASGVASGGTLPLGGSMAVRAAREARARATQLETALKRSEAELSELRDKLQQIEAATGIQGLVSEGGSQSTADPRAKVEATSGEQCAESAPGADAASSGEASEQQRLRQQEQQQRFDKLKSHLVSLTREVAALTRERDALLGVVMQAAAAAKIAADTALADPQGRSAVGSPTVSVTSLTTPQEMLAQLLVSSGAGGPDAAPVLSGLMDSSLLHALLAPPAARSPGQRQGKTRGRGRSTLIAGGVEKPLAPTLRLPPLNSWQQGSSVSSSVSAGLAELLGGGSGSAGGAVLNKRQPPRRDAERPAFDSRMPAESKMHMQRQRDRAARVGEGLSGGGMSGLLAAVPSSSKDADVVGLKQKLVQAEKARAELQARAQAEIRSVQLQAASIARQAASTARLHAEKVRALERERQAEVSRVRSEAAAAITALMEENTRLKGALAAQVAVNQGIVGNAAGSNGLALPSLGPAAGRGVGLGPLLQQRGLV